MIEKFSDEELKQIKMELGIGKKSLEKPKVLRKELIELNEIWGNKPFSKYNCICSVIDITLCNVELSERFILRKNERCTRNTMRRIIKEKDIDEYKQMFREIIEIIKKHNRKWEEDNGHENSIGDDID